MLVFIHRLPIKHEPKVQSQNPYQTAQKHLMSLFVLHRGHRQQEFDNSYLSSSWAYTQTEMGFQPLKFICWALQKYWDTLEFLKYLFCMGRVVLISYFDGRRRRFVLIKKIEQILTYPSSLIPIPRDSSSTDGSIYVLPWPSLPCPSIHDAPFCPLLKACWSGPLSPGSSLIAPSLLEPLGTKLVSAAMGISIGSGCDSGSCCTGFVVVSSPS